MEFWISDGQSQNNGKASLFQSFKSQRFLQINNAHNSTICIQYSTYEKSVILKTASSVTCFFLKTVKYTRQLFRTGLVSTTNLSPYHIRYSSNLIILEAVSYCCCFLFVCVLVTKKKLTSFMRLDENHCLYVSYYM